MVNPKKFWPAHLAIFAFSLYLFLPSLNYYFFQDDWFVLNWVRSGDLQSFFGFRTDIIYWRPLSMPLLFAFLKTIFGLNYQLYHAFAFSILIVLSIAVYTLFLILTDSKKQSLIASFIYTTWPIHYISLSWLSTTSYLIGPLFQCLSFIFFLKYQESKKFINKISTYLFFLLGLMSSEFTLVLPVIFLTWTMFFKKRKTSVIFFLPMFLIVIIYFFLRFVAFPVPASGTYTPVFNEKIAYNFLWYILWAFGLPESFKSLIFPNLPDQSLKVITQFWSITLPTTILAILVAYQTITHLKNKLPLVFGFFWLAIGLLPVITVTNHSYPMYLSFAGLGFIFAVVTVFKNAKTKAVITLLLLWSIISITNLHFTRLTHWVKNEQAISKSYVNYTMNKLSKPEPNTVFVFKPANAKFASEHNFVLVEGEETLKLSLNDQSAMQLIYNDPTIKSIYETNSRKVSFPPETQIFEIWPSL